MWMWAFEIMQFPLLINIVNTGICKFSSEKLIIKEVNCYDQLNFNGVLSAQE